MQVITGAGLREKKQAVKDKYQKKYFVRQSNLMTVVKARHCTPRCYCAVSRAKLTCAAQTKTASLIILFPRGKQSIVFFVRPSHILHASVYPTTPLKENREAPKTHDPEWAASFCVVNVSDQFISVHTNSITVKHTKLS